MLIVGLGNPDQHYVKNRHNIGFMAVDRIAEAFPRLQDFKKNFKPQGGGLLAKINLAGTPCFLLKPQNYMNRSGAVVQAALQFYKIAPKAMLVIHDELDLPFARMRVKYAGGAGGHNGLKSIDQLIGQDYWRLRVGIDHPGAKHLVSPYVLHDFDPDEAKAIPSMLDHIVDCLPLFTVEAGQSEKFQAEIGAFRR